MSGQSFVYLSMPYPTVVAINLINLPVLVSLFLILVYPVARPESSIGTLGALQAVSGRITVATVS